MRPGRDLARPERPAVTARNGPRCADRSAAEPSGGVARQRGEQRPGDVGELLETPPVGVGEQEPGHALGQRADAARERVGVDGRAAAPGQPAVEQSPQLAQQHAPVGVDARGQLGRRTLRREQHHAPRARVGGHRLQVGGDAGEQQLIGVAVVGGVVVRQRGEHRGQLGEGPLLGAIGRRSKAARVVANAGIAAGGRLLLADPRTYDRVVEVNLLGSIRTVRALLPHVVASHGYVLQVASLAAMVPAPLMSAYCASKSGVEAFAHALRGEVAHHGVDVGVAYFSWTDTDMLRGADAVPGLGEYRAQLPWVFGRTYPLEPAVARVVRGIERRSPHVYPQPWLRALQTVRGALPGGVARVGARHAPDAERVMLAAGPEAGRAVGAGGAADLAARR